MFKLSVRQEEKGELKPRTSAGCKMSFEPFGKSPTNRRKTREHSAKRSSFVSAVWEMSGFISVISHLQHFYRPSASPNCFPLSGVSRRNQCIMFSKPESYTACSYPRQLFLSIRFTQLKWVRLKKALSSAAELVPNFSESLSWHIKTHWTNFVCCASTWSNLCQGLLAGSEHIVCMRSPIWISDSQNMQ